MNPVSSRLRISQLWYKPTNTWFLSISHFTFVEIEGKGMNTIYWCSCYWLFCEQAMPFAYFENLLSSPWIHKSMSGCLLPECRINFRLLGFLILKNVLNFVTHVPIINACNYMMNLSYSVGSLNLSLFFGHLFIIWPIFKLVSSFLLIHFTECY